MAEAPRGQEKDLPSIDSPQPILKALQEMTDEQRAKIEPVFSGSPGGFVPGRDTVRDLDSPESWEIAVVKPGQGFPQVVPEESSAPRRNIEPTNLAPESETRHYTGSPSGRYPTWGTGSGRKNEL